MRAIVLVIVLSAASILVAGPGRADDQDDHHVATVGEIRVLHAWVRASGAGGSTLGFMEIDNDGPADVLASASSEAAGAVRIVGVALKDGDAAVVDVGPVDVPPGLTPFDPGGLALLLDRLEIDLVEGGEVEIELEFAKAGVLHLHAEVLPATAARHPHAGHAH